MPDTTHTDPIREIIVKHTGEMLDNPYGNGLYPTSKFYENLETDVAALIRQAEERGRVDENESMKEALRGYAPHDWCHNHDHHVTQCYACRKAKWGNYFCGEFTKIIDERLADLATHKPTEEKSNG